jgi:hypothetical protein
MNILTGPGTQENPSMIGDNNNQYNAKPKTLVEIKVNTPADLLWPEGQLCYGERKYHDD